MGYLLFPIWVWGSAGQAAGAMLKLTSISTEGNSSLVIISEIVMTCMPDYILMLSGEFKYWSMVWFTV